VRDGGEYREVEVQAELTRRGEARRDDNPSKIKIIN
jgi:hypothetical protein